MNKTQKLLAVAGLAAILATPVSSVFADTSGEQTFQDKGSIQLTYQVIDSPKEVTVAVKQNSRDTGINANKILIYSDVFLTSSSFLILILAKQQAQNEED